MLFRSTPRPYTTTTFQPLDHVSSPLSLLMIVICGSLPLLLPPGGWLGWGGREREGQTEREVHISRGKGGEEETCMRERAETFDILCFHQPSSPVPLLPPVQDFNSSLMVSFHKQTLSEFPDIHLRVRAPPGGYHKEPGLSDVRAHTYTTTHTPQVYTSITHSFKGSLE